ncbi:MAG: hypothetical protein MI723_16525 [Caulobacterales bacterium]|nr:hypothetical protein [Caulobacterales bacterium]
MHIAPENLAKRIRRNGLAPLRAPGSVFDGCVWTFPVLESYELTHQWARELKRLGAHALAAATVRVPDGEPVMARHFRQAPAEMTAAEAVGLIRAQPDPRGYEIIVPRRITPREIVRVRTLPKAIGWRYAPEEKDADRYPCDCPVCAPRGEVKARRYRDRIALLQARWEAKRGA